LGGLGETSFTVPWLGSKKRGKVTVTTTTTIWRRIGFFSKVQTTEGGKLGWGKALVGNWLVHGEKSKRKTSDAALVKGKEKKAGRKRCIPPVVCSSSRGESLLVERNSRTKTLITVGYIRVVILH